MKINRLVTIAVLLAASAGTLDAQNIRTAYFMDQAPVRSKLNPAFRPNKGYINIPVIGGLYGEYTSNAFSIDEVLKPDGSGNLVTILDDRFSTSEKKQFYNDMDLKGDNNMFASFNTTILGFGWYTGRKGAFLSFNIDNKTFLGLNTTKDFFRLATIGRWDDGSSNFDMSGSSIDAMSFMELGAAYSRPFGTDLTVGVRVKFLAGLGNARAKYNKLNVLAAQERWEVSADGSFNGSFNNLTIPDKTEGSDTYLDFGNIDWEVKGVSGYGASIDLGALYRLTDNLSLSGAVVDLGFISWSEDNTVSAGSSHAYSFEGVQVGGAGGMDTEELKKSIRFERDRSKSRTTGLNTIVNVGLEYSLYNRICSFGLMSSTEFRPSKTYSELTVSTMVRPTKWFTGTLSYSTMHSYFDTFGFALNFHPGWVNFFVGSDYMFTKVSKQYIPISQKAANFYLGLNVPIGRKYINCY